MVSTDRRGSSVSTCIWTEFCNQVTDIEIIPEPLEDPGHRLSLFGRERLLYSSIDLPTGHVHLCEQSQPVPGDGDVPPDHNEGLIG